MEQSNSSVPQEIETESQEIDPAIQDYLNSGYDKHIKRARIILFVIAGFQIVTAFIASMQSDPELLAAIWIESIIITATFIVIAFWAKKKPYKALLTSIIVYLSYQALLVIINPVYIFMAFIPKIIIVVLLFLGLSNAKSNMKS
jgi:hypothetical protein